ncbi:hypothetical protein F4821DRAFT_251506 [Hypoxylon rubiginosum]|uniref:Uncharacterized protein n=1 Tax=Hypoxylon rubiginosum TaxID=110542 RepID=A0ACC0CJ27_9PEZI|nr:hypothetical protein F4821DRAFT_251506 [Hypoxylon rubiginosum]
MLYKTALSALLFSALAIAAPPTSPVSLLLQPRTDACSADPNIGYCKTLTYNDRTVAGAPSGDACQNTCRSVLADAGDWTVDFHGKGAGYLNIMLSSACSFAVSRVSDKDAAQFEFPMHNLDILDVIGGAVGRFAGKHGGNVKADGTMECSGHVVKWYVG